MLEFCIRMTSTRRMTNGNDDKSDKIEEREIR